MDEFPVTNDMFIGAGGRGQEEDVIFVQFQHGNVPEIGNLLMYGSLLEGWH